jgi:hypothetical protein
VRKNRDKLRAIGFMPRALRPGGWNSKIANSIKVKASKHLFGGWGVKIRGRIEIQPRFKIQYPMKNHYKDALYCAKRCMVLKKISCVIIRI